MQFMKHLVAAAALTVAGSAMAATYDVGTLTVGTPQSISELVLGSGSFSDVISFDIAAGSSAQFNVSTFTLAPFVYNTISSLTLSVYDGSTLLSAIGGVYALGAGTDYSFHVSGVSTNNGAYSVNYQLAAIAPAVPEAGSMAMSLAGLGLLGLVASRRRRSD